MNSHSSEEEKDPTRRIQATLDNAPDPRRSAKKWIPPLEPLIDMKIARNLDKIGSFGAVVAAAMAPCCFPLLGIIGTALGLGAMERFAPQLQYAVQMLVVIA